MVVVFEFIVEVLVRMVVSEISGELRAEPSVQSKSPIPAVKVRCRRADKSVVLVKGCSGVFNG